MGIFREIIGDAGAYETITPGDTATGITKSVRQPTTGAYAGLSAVAALITVEANTVTVAFDGSTPTNAAGTNLGHKLAATDSLFLRGVKAVQNFKCVDTVSLSAGVVKVTLYF